MPDTSKDRLGSWMQTFTGIQFWPLDPRPDEISFIDIGAALSKVCRFGGHTTQFYSVAEHAWHLSYYVSEENALAALLHDAAEAYIGDMVRPLKRHMIEFQNVEQVLMDQIAGKVGLDNLLPYEVRDADNRILLDERAALLNPSPASWIQDIEGISPLDIEICAFDPDTANEHFMSRLQELLNGKDIL